MSKTLEILSLGGGVQSSTLLEMALLGQTDAALDAVIFADTGDEPAKVMAQIAYLENKCAAVGLPFYRVSGGNIRDFAMQRQGRFASLPLHVRNTDGRSSMIKRQCTSDFKIAPIERKIRELLGVSKGQRVPKTSSVRQWIGISLDEIWRMRDGRHAWATNYYPLIEKRLTRHDCLLWLTANNLPIPAKSSCKICPFHNDAYWRTMKADEPADFTDVTKFDVALRSGEIFINKAALRGNVYMHKSLIPLSEVDFSNATDRGQQEMFIEECSGVCGS